jgi:hypothetical protein
VVAAWVELEPDADVSGGGSLSVASRTAAGFRGPQLPRTAFSAQATLSASASAIPG